MEILLYFGYPIADFDMRSTQITIKLLIISFIWSCAPEATPPQMLETISFVNPQIGQTSRYILLQGENYHEEKNTNFSYLFDTLQVSVTEVHDGYFVVKEALTEGSISRHGQSRVSFADSTFYYHIVVNDNLELTIKAPGERTFSRLFFIQEGATELLPLTNFQDLKVDIVGWKTSLPVVNEKIQAFTQDFDLFDQTFPKLNVLVDNRNMRRLGVGQTHIYSATKGLVRSSQYNSSTGAGFGWDLLPNGYE